jgi:two-component system, cell cycle sensor histidine kinase and response regulator CckA
LKRQREVKNAVPQTLRHVIGNPAQLRQALMDLCLNAREAMPSGGVLTIDAQTASIHQTASVLQQFK